MYLKINKMEELTEQDLEIIKKEYAKGKRITDIFYDNFGIPSRNKVMTKDIDTLYRLIRIPNIERAESLLNTLEEILGIDDGDCIQARTSIDLQKAGL